MKNELLVTLVYSLVENAIDSMEVPQGVRGPRGFRGHDGRDGNSFSLEDHKETIKKFVDEVAPKFLELSPEDKAQLIGPQGKAGRPGKDGVDGRDGKDGKDFSLEDNLSKVRQEVSNLIESEREKLKLKFEDLTEEEKRKIRGPRGQRGKAGKDFIFDEHSEKINSIIVETVSSLRDSLKLKFEDLNPEEVAQLKGPKGEKGSPGKAGKDFSFQESKEDIAEIILDNKKHLKLKFDDLSEEEKDAIKLKFEHLSPEEIQLLRGDRGPRGQRGKSGDQGPEGVQGVRGPQGVRGVPGVQGVQGIQGPAGRDGEDGQDAPQVSEIIVRKGLEGKTYLVFVMSNGQRIRSNSFEIGNVENHNYFVSGGSGGGLLSLYENGELVGEAKNIDFVGDNVTLTESEDGETIQVETEGKDISVYDDGHTITERLTDVNFYGDQVQVFPMSPISDWPSMDVVDDISSYSGEPPEGVDVYIGFQNIVFVESLENLPPAENGVITLDQGKSYYFTARVDLLGARLVCPRNVSLVGSSYTNCGIKSNTSDFLITSNYDLQVRFLELEADKVFNMSSDPLERNIFQLSSLRILNATNVGNVSGYDKFNMTSCIVENSTGLSWSGQMEVIEVERCSFIGGTGIHVDVGADLALGVKFEILYTRFEVDAGQIGVHVSETATIPVESYILERATFVGDGTYISGVTRESNTALFVRCLGIVNTSVSGQMYMRNNTAPTVITTANTWVKAAGVTIPSDDNSHYLHSDNRLTNDAVIERTFRVSFRATITAGSNDEVNLGFYDSKLGDIRVPSRTTTIVGPGGRVEGVSSECLVQHSQGQYLELWVRNISANNVTVEDMNIVISQL